MEINKSRIKLIEEYLKKNFSESKFFDNVSDMNYRLEHSYRVANIGKIIAREEGMNEETMIVGCLLHDVAYCTEFTDNDYKNHGRDSAKMVRPFLIELGYNESQVNEICYGIAIHVDDLADFEGERTPFALTIGDADNIDRFDVFRIYENLKRIKYDELSIKEKKNYVNPLLEKLEKYKKLEFATNTAQKMWEEKVNFQIAFFTNLKLQNDNSTSI